VISNFLEERLTIAARQVLGEDVLIKVTPCNEEVFGDYQSTSIIQAAKARKLNPRKLAEDILARANFSDFCESVNIAGAGFINFVLRPEAVVKFLKELVSSKFVFEKARDRRTVIIDFSSPNVAKPMHVGHIRSTIIGDSLARVFRFLGHNVITDNHLGDWGTQFGKLIVGWKKFLDEKNLQADPIGEMERLYKLVNGACEHDENLLNEARAELVKLQSGDEENLGLWKRMLSLSLNEFEKTYQRLGVKFDYILGESFYNNELKSVITELTQKGLAKESQGALVVFFDDLPELKSHPAIILKSDGAANYMTTDLATINYRVREWNPDEIIYVTDARQQLHFKQVFEIFYRWKPEFRGKLKLVHVWFGTILGPDGKPFKTRSGDVVKLSDLLDEAEERAYKIVSEKNPSLTDAERIDIARIVGIGAVKYADLMQNRQSDYVFNWDKMLALNGNTAPYLQYAYARIQSIFRRSGQEFNIDNLNELDYDSVLLGTAEELKLAKHILKFGSILESVVEDCKPNYLCNYLYELACYFTAFYENCPVLKATEQERSSRLLLCGVTAWLLKLGLDLLGIQVPEKM